MIAGSDVLHGDDTTVPILAPGTGKTRTGPTVGLRARRTPPRRVERPPAAVFFASPDRRGERPLAHLAAFTGVLQADGYSRLQRPVRAQVVQGGALIEAACWAHARRYFFDVHAKTGSAVAREALERIGALYEVERSITGKPPDERQRQRQARSRPLADALKAWAETILPQLSGRSELAGAFRYMLARWPALTRVLDDGRIALDNNPAERALRGVAVGRKNYLFAGSNRGAERAAALYSLIESAKLNGPRSRGIPPRRPHPHRRLPGSAPC